jgi:branched-subunit amino acid ABC-type transport system permease component
LENTNEINNTDFWKKKINEHWKVFIVIIIAGICVAIGVILVLIWFVETSDIGLQGTATFDQWSLAWVVGFIIILILWELLFVGIPVGLFFGVGGYLWWRKLPEEEKQEFKGREKDAKRHRKKNMGGFSFFMFIAYCVYIAIEGNFFTPFGNLPYSYWLYAYLWTIMWLLIIVGIPGAIIGLIYFKKWLNKPSN